MLWIAFKSVEGCALAYNCVLLAKLPMPLQMKLSKGHATARLMCPGAHLPQGRMGSPARSTKSARYNIYATNCQ